MLLNEEIKCIEEFLKVVYNRVNTKEGSLDLYWYIKEFNEQLVSNRLNEIQEKESPLVKSERRRAFQEVLKNR